MREVLTDNLSVKLDIEEIKKKLVDHDKNIELVLNYLDKLMEKQENPPPRKQIGYMLPKKKNIGKIERSGEQRPGTYSPIDELTFTIKKNIKL